LITQVALAGWVTSFQSRELWHNS